MILLPQQFQMCIIHFCFGWLFGFFYSFYKNIFTSIFSPSIQKISEFFFFTFFTLTFYYTLYSINGGLTHFYCILLFCFGVYIYYQLYFMTFSHFFNFIVNILLFFKEKLTLAFSKSLAIIDMQKKLKNWRSRLGKQKRKSRRNKKKNP